MNILKRKLLVNALGDGYEDFIEDLYKALSLYPGGSSDLIGKIKNMLDVLSVSDLSSQANSANIPNDYRFRYLLINNYRKFDMPKAQANYYGLSFCEYNGKLRKDEIRNLFLLGGNGSGKSSLFNSMEYVFTDRIGEADYRGIKDLDWFVHRSIDVKPQVKVFTMNGVYDLENSKFKDIAKHDVHRFFFSENSIYELSKYMVSDKGNDQADWVPFFCYALEMEDILGFLNGAYRHGGKDKSIYEEVCEKLKLVDGNLAVDYARQRKDTETFISDACLVLTPNAEDVIEDFYEKLNSLFEQKEKYSVEELLIKVRGVIPNDILYISSLNDFRNNIDKLYRQYRNDRRSRYIDQDEHLPNIFKGPKLSIQDVLSEVEKMMQSLKVILNHCNTNIVPFEEIGNKVNYLLDLRSTFAFYGKSAGILNISELLERLKTFKIQLEKELSSTIDAYVDSEFMNVVVETLKDKFIDAKTEKLVFERRTSGSFLETFGIDISVNGIPVNKYFNTFRFRLFTLCLLTAFNFKAMKEYNFRFPFIFDDIFYANDYRNKAELYNFFKVLEKEASLYLGDKGQLQVIFFTHDEQFLGTLRFNKDEFFANSIMARLLEKDLVQTISGDKYVDKDMQKECYLNLSQKINR